jgi:hypothetical protein
MDLNTDVNLGCSGVKNLIYTIKKCRTSRFEKTAVQALFRVFSQRPQFPFQGKVFHPPREHLTFHRFPSPGSGYAVNHVPGGRGGGDSLNNNNGWGEKDTSLAEELDCKL